MFELQMQHAPDVQETFCFSDKAPPAPKPSPAARPAETAPTFQTRRAKTWGPRPGERRTMATAVEVWIRGKGAPYIAVDEAKKALFTGAKLKSFHFVVYRPDGQNWLVWAAKGFTKDERADLKQWQEIFGDGFVSVRAFQRADGFEFRKLDGEAVAL